jgi:hypothetical protein
MKVLGAQGSLGFEPFKVGAPIVPREGVGVEYLKVSIFYSRLRDYPLADPVNDLVMAYAWQQNDRGS